MAEAKVFRLYQVLSLGWQTTHKWRGQGQSRDPFLIFVSPECWVLAYTWYKLESSNSVYRYTIWDVKSPSDGHGQGHMTRFWIFGPRHISTRLEWVSRGTSTLVRRLIVLSTSVSNMIDCTPNGLCLGLCDLLKFWYISDNISETIKIPGFALQWKTNGKSCMICWMTPIQMTSSDLEGHFSC